MAFSHFRSSEKWRAVKTDVVTISLLIRVHVCYQVWRTSCPLLLQKYPLWSFTMFALAWRETSASTIHWLVSTRFILPSDFNSQLIDLIYFIICIVTLPFSGPTQHTPACFICCHWQESEDPLLCHEGLCQGDYAAHIHIHGIFETHYPFMF